MDKFCLLFQSSICSFGEMVAVVNESEKVDSSMNENHWRNIDDVRFCETYFRDKRKFNQYIKKGLINVPFF